MYYSIFMNYDILDIHNHESLWKSLWCFKEEKIISLKMFSCYNLKGVYLYENRYPWGSKKNVIEHGNKHNVENVSLFY